MISDTINDAMTSAGSGEGTLLANRYRVVRQLGQGGMGSVWLAEDTQLDNKPFAIKMLPAILVANKRAYRQLKDEALVAMKLTHPNIVTLRAFEENNGNPFLVMDYIAGQALDDYLVEKGKLPEDEAIRVLRPIAAALDYAHGEGVVHRDVKPANVMIRKDGHPFILDFGIAREIQETMTRVTGKLSSGTLLYMSPEQLHGASPKPAQDIYSFAAMAYECLKGEPPFVRGQIEYQIDNDMPEPLYANAHAELTGKAAILAAGVMSGLAKKPVDRPPSCTNVLAWSIPNAPQKERVDSFGHKERKDHKGSAWKVLLALPILCLVVGGAWYYHLRQEAVRTATEQKARDDVARSAKQEHRPTEARKAQKAHEELERRKTQTEQLAKQKEEEARKVKEEQRRQGNQHELTRREEVRKEAGAEKSNRDISSEDWNYAVKSLMVGQPFISFDKEEGTTKTKIVINGNTYGDGELVSVTQGDIRFTWRIQGLGAGDKLRLARIRARRIPNDVTRTGDTQTVTLPKGVTMERLLAQSAGLEKQHDMKTQENGNPNAVRSIKQLRADIEKGLAEIHRIRTAQANTQNGMEMVGLGQELASLKNSLRAQDAIASALAIARERPDGRLPNEIRYYLNRQFGFDGKTIGIMDGGIDSKTGDFLFTFGERDQAGNVATRRQTIPLSLQLGLMEGYPELFSKDAVNKHRERMLGSGFTQAEVDSCSKVARMARENLAKRLEELALQDAKSEE